jgi:vacuolar protein sorting-associated protein 29
MFSLKKKKNRNFSLKLIKKMLVLLLGDLNIPFVASDLPLKFKKLLVPGKIQHILFAGNLTCSSTFEYLRTICSDITLIQGDFDSSSSAPLPISFHNIRLGLVHAHSLLPFQSLPSLDAKARELDVDVLVVGNGSQFHAEERDGRMIVFPGSATGAYLDKVLIETLKQYRCIHLNNVHPLFY